MGIIVAGTDGSDGARAALAWALDEARRRNASLHVVHAWEMPVTAYPGPYFGARGIDIEAGLEAYRTNAEELGSEIRSWLAANGKDVTTSVSVLEGAATAKLLEAATEADLLVLGARGHGGFSALLLGSVSDRCTRDAPCTVVIVPADERAAGA